MTVTGRRARGLGGLLGALETPEVTFSIRVPRRADLELVTSGGSVGVADLDGRVQARTSGGSLSVGNVSGPVWARTSGGSVALEASGEADLGSSGGSVRIGDIGDLRAETAGGSIVAPTSGGSIEATLGSQPEGDCRLSASGGSITVRLAVAVDLDAQGSRVACDLPVTVSGPIEHGRLSGTINGGGPRLDLHASGGTIRIAKL